MKDIERFYVPNWDMECMQPNDTRVTDDIGSVLVEYGDHKAAVDELVEALEDISKRTDVVLEWIESGRINDAKNLLRVFKVIINESVKAQAAIDEYRRVSDE